MALLAALLSVTSAQAQPPAGSPPDSKPGMNAFIPDANIRTLLDARIKAGKARGYAIALIERNGEVRILAAGSSGNAARETVDGDTIFEIGSITKTFTGTLLAQLQEEGRLKPESTVGDIVARTLPKVQLKAGGVGGIRLEALATHTSGLPRLPKSLRFYAGMLTQPDNPYAGFSREDLWSYLQDYKHDAGKSHPSAYSNLGMGLLGDLLAQNEGTDFNSLVQRRIAAPLGLRDTAQDTAPVAKNRLAVGHDEKLKPVSYWDLSVMTGAGGLRSTAREMALYLKAQQSGTLAGARAAQQPRVKMSDSAQVGFAWITTRRHGDEIVWHNGGTGGFRSFAGFSKVSGRGIVMLTNSAHAQDDLALHLLNPGFRLED